MQKTTDIYTKTHPAHSMGIGNFAYPKEHEKKNTPHLFDLSSHKRAKEAIEFGLKVRRDGFHVFVVGEDRSGRMTSTMDYLKDYVKKLPTPSDWVYLHNFKKNHRPLPFRLPAGMACRLHQDTKEHIQNIESVLKKTFSSTGYLKQVDKISNQLDQKLAEQFDEIQTFANQNGWMIEQSSDGFHVQALPNSVEKILEEPTKKIKKEKKSTLPSLSPEDIKKQKRLDEKNIEKIREQLHHLTMEVNLANRHVTREIKHLQEKIAKDTTRDFWKKYRSEYGMLLGRWIHDFEKDVLENSALFFKDEEEKSPTRFEHYDVNIFINNHKHNHPRVLLEAQPTFENLFGAIKNRVSTSGMYETNFMMVRPGALHLANGGILVLRAEDIAREPEVWEYLKVCLRDKHIRIKEHYREQHTPLLMDAPKPKEIPLDVQIFIIGLPDLYDAFFFSDPDFRIYFKVKADIDSDLPTTPENIQAYCALIHHTAQEHLTMSIAKDAVLYLAQCSTRWTEDRKKLSGRFELISDVLAEARAYARDENVVIIQPEHIRKTLLGRRVRNSRVQDRVYDTIQKGIIRLETKGYRVGQVNGLTVLSVGNHSFGMPARISARTFIGERGVINIARLTDMSGPIQQKGTFILDGYLSSLFAQEFPISFNGSLTFEQNYHEVEGDSASMAELCALLSSLSETPLNQSIAITGSVDQFGHSQAVGGIHHKVEGFFHMCERQGLTGKQGVIIPRANADHLTLQDELVDAIRRGQFHIWCVDNIHEALEILTFPPKPTRWFQRHQSIFDKAYQKLKSYRHALKG